jgi:hypothetical protein
LKAPRPVLSSSFNFGIYIKYSGIFSYYYKNPPSVYPVNIIPRFTINLSNILPNLSGLNNNADSSIVLKGSVLASY